MPTSIPRKEIIDLLFTLQPKRVLDIGVGFGKWGFLSREILDVYSNQKYKKKEWLTTIDGFEIFKKYHNPVWDYVYNKVYIGDANRLIDKVANYDLIIFTEVIEHIEKEKGKKLLRKIVDKSNFGVIVSFPDSSDPKLALAQGAVFDNVHETHVSLWCEEDLIDFKYEKIGDFLYYVFGETVGSPIWLYKNCYKRGDWHINSENTAKNKNVLYSNSPKSSIIIPNNTGSIELSYISHKWCGKFLLVGDKELIVDSYSNNSKYKQLKIKTTKKEFVIELLQSKNKKSFGFEQWFNYILY